MTTVVLLVLAIVWAVLLLSWLRSRTNGTFSDSVGAFRRHLSVLERATPATVTPANRLRNGAVGGRQPALHGQPALYRRTARPATLRSGYPSRSTAPAMGGTRQPLSTGSSMRRQAQKRRRDVFFALLAAVVGTFLVALISGLTLLWAIQVVVDVLFLAYVALLIRMRNLAAERELKLTFMPPPVRPGRVRPGYDYRELSLRRAAN